VEKIAGHTGIMVRGQTKKAGMGTPPMNRTRNSLGTGDGCGGKKGKRSQETQCRGPGEKEKRDHKNPGLERKRKGNYTVGVDSEPEKGEISGDETRTPGKGAAREERGGTTRVGRDQSLVKGGN